MTYVPLTVVVTVVVNGFLSENFGFSPPPPLYADMNSIGPELT